MAYDSDGLSSLVCGPICYLYRTFIYGNHTGIIPGAGDVADATLNYVLVVRKARQAEYVYFFTVVILTQKY